MNILMSYTHYPLTVARFFKAAFRRLGVNVLSVGPYADHIPWTDKNCKHFLDRPDIEMPRANEGDLDWVMAHPDVRAFRPLALFQFDAAYRLLGTRHPNIPWVHVATDPHVPLNYEQAFFRCDYPVTMQKFYGETAFKSHNPQWVPYAFDPFIHYYTPAGKAQDVTLLTGLLYPQRRAVVEALRGAGLSVLVSNQYILAEGTEVYNQGRIALNWSSEFDLPMRFWEGLVYRNVVLTNRTPELGYVPEFIEGTDFLAFDSVAECVEKALWVMAHPAEAETIARNGHAKVWIGKHTYTQRARRLLGIAGYV